MSAQAPAAYQSTTSNGTPNVTVAAQAAAAAAAGAPPTASDIKSQQAAVAAVALQQHQAAGNVSMPIAHGGVTVPPGFAAYPTNMVFTAPDPGLVDDQPTYVNPKQYARILKRRESRKKQTGTDVTSYTPRKRSYMHESRHKHAMQRRRGPGGRFLSKQERADLVKEADKQAAAAAAAANVNNNEPNKVATPGTTPAQVATGTAGGVPTTGPPGGVGVVAPDVVPKQDA